MTEKFESMLEHLARFPGLGFLQRYADKMTMARHQVRNQRERADELRGYAQESGASVGGAVGVGGAGDDKTVMRPGAGAGDDHTVIRPTPGGDDRTVMRPTPGRRPAAPGAVPPPAPPVFTGEPAAVHGSKLNPLVDAATVLLSLVGQLRGTAVQPDVQGLRNQVVREVQTFERTATAQTGKPKLVLAARYALCTVLDEVVLSTPWGATSQWSDQSLLSAFHNETRGGEKFFQILERSSQDPGRNLDLLELLYICVSLGFEGKYGVMERGREQLASVQEGLYRVIRGQRGEHERELSPQWRGIQDKRSALVRHVPLWVVAALAGALLTILYVGFTYTLSNSSDPVFRSLLTLGRDQAPVVAAPAPVRPRAAAPAAPAPAPAPAPPSRLAGLPEELAAEVDAGLVNVTEAPGQATIVIHGEGLFRSGRAQVEAGRRPLLARVAEALNTVPGRVMVTGHTDSVPIRTLRFPSNWHLSEARAKAVRDVIASGMDEPERLAAEGRADTEPVAPNDTPANRARNRRVEVLVTDWGGG